MTTKHQAPEVTSELRECPLCNRAPKRNGRTGVGGVICQSPGHLVQVYGASQVDADKNWNTRATQPQSLTIDEAWLRECLADLLGEHDPSCGYLDRTHTAEKIAPLLLDRLQSLSGEQIAENANCSGAAPKHGEMG